MSQTIKVIFTLSIVLNIILLGLVGGGGLKMFRHWGHHGDLQKELASLPPDVQERIEEAFEQSRQEMRTLFKEAKTAREGVRNALNADPFDEGAYQLAVERLNQIRYKMLQIKSRKTGLIASELNTEDRRRFAGYLIRGGRGGHFMQHKQTERPPPSKQSIQQNSAADRPAKVQEEPLDPVMLPMPEFEE